MSDKFHIVYVTKLGVPFIEEAQEFPDAATALSAAVNAFHVKDERGKIIKDNHGVPLTGSIMVRTHDNSLVVIDEYDHLRVLTPEELRKIQEEEEAARNGLPY